MNPEYVNSKALHYLNLINYLDQSKYFIKVPNAQGIRQRWEIIDGGYYVAFIIFISRGEIAYGWDYDTKDCGLKRGANFDEIWEVLIPVVVQEEMLFYLDLFRII